MRPAEARGQVFNQGILMSSRCLRFVVLICALFGVGGCGAGENAGALSEVLRSAATTAPVDSNSAFSADGGGCYLLPVSDDPADLRRLQAVNPEWAPVVHGASPQSAPVLAHGIARESHVSKEDFPAGHVTFDQNTELELDPADRVLLASGNGDPKTATLELEWETGSYPAWAWAGVGDRVVVLGRWIFDCGHPDPIPGACHGTSALCVTDLDCAAGTACEGTKFNYRSEIHPPQATAVIRSGRGGLLEKGDDAKPATRADVWVSADGGAAGDSCVVTHRDPLNLLIFGESAFCFPLHQPLALIAPADGVPPPFYATDFSFDIPLPAVRGGREPFLRTVGRETPAIGGARIPASLRAVSKPGGSQPHFEVTVRMTELVNGRRPTGFAATLLAGWRDGPEEKLAHLRVSIEGVVVRDALKSPTLPDGWKVQVNVNGEWQEIAGLEEVKEGKTGLYPVSATYDLYLPRDGTLSVHADASSTACVDTLFNQSLLTDLVSFGLEFDKYGVPIPSTLQTALAKGSACLADTERDAGEVNASFAGPHFGVKAEPYELASVGGAAGGGAFNLRFRVERIREDREDHDGEEVSLLQPDAK
jgi:hypothetical protein